MKLFFVILTLFFWSYNLSAQTSQELIIINDYISNHLSDWKLANDDVNDLIITDQYQSAKSRTTHIYLRQAINDIEVYSANASAHINNDQLVSFNQSFISNISTKINATTPSLTNEEAIQKAAIHLGNNQTYTLVPINETQSPNQQITYLGDLLAHDNISSKLSFFPIKDDLVLCFEIAINDITTQKWWQIFVNANSGIIEEKISWTIECIAEDHHIFDDKMTFRNSPTIPVESPLESKVAVVDNSYNIFALPFLSPLDGTRTIETEPWTPASNASPYGWHDTDGSAGAEYTITRGNNVLAQEDTNGNNGTGYSPDGGMELIFDHPFDEHDQPIDYQDAAITNLFYWNNILHDVWYQYGFDENSGNFQSNNYGNGGVGNDYVLADAQDGSGSNNANISVPPEGSNPRMQMFEWSAKSFNTFTINSPAGIARNYGCGGAEFGPQNVVVTGDIVLASPTDGCTALTNPIDIDENIALIERGNCTFVEKVKIAQNAGAIAVIICNDTSSPPTSMGGTDNTITIPSIMLSKLNCDTIKSYLPGVNITMDINSPITKDSDLENGVIAHEYGHGISIRITGGPSNSSCLNNSEQMGEGWSDWFALIMSIQEGDIDIATRGMGPYLTGEPLNANGIRTFPYTTDMNLNTHTYDNIKSAAVPHGVGSIWCAMLWEMTWGLIDEHGWDPDIYAGTGGNNIAMELVVEALKLQPCSPGFIDARDAILQADLNLNAGINECIIWEAFAKRGLGYSATQGSSSSVSDGSEAFDISPSCNDTLLLTKSSNFQVESGTDLIYELTITNFKSIDLTNVIITDTLPPNTSLVNGSLTCGSITGDIITIDISSLTIGSSDTCTYAVTTNDVNNSIVTFFDGIESGTSNWTISSGQGSAQFVPSATNPYGGTTSWFVPNVGANNSQFITLNPVTLGSDPVLTFRHSYDTESSWDGGMVEISIDAGVNWTDLGQNMIFNGYNGSLGNGSNSDIDFRAAFTGNSGGYIESFAELSNFANQEVMIRFFFGSDDNTFETGWYIDNVLFIDANYIHNYADATCTEGFTGSAQENTLVKIDCNTPVTVYEDVDTDGYGDPNSFQTLCSIPGGYVTNHDDCDDTNIEINPDSSEICDGIDNNCDGITDEGCGNFECDGDSLFINTLTMDEFHAEDYINSDAIVSSAGDVEFTAGIDIDLAPGFEVVLGTVFDAYISICMPLFRIHKDDNPIDLINPNVEWKEISSLLDEQINRLAIYDSNYKIVDELILTESKEMDKQTLIQVFEQLNQGNYFLLLNTKSGTQLRRIMMLEELNAR